MSDITDRPEYNPCPKCGDDTRSRVAKFRLLEHLEEVLDVRCLACGAPLATVRPLDAAVIPGQPVRDPMLYLKPNKETAP